jgi:hypothetical protein
MQSGAKVRTHLKLGKHTLISSFHYFRYVTSLRVIFTVCSFTTLNFQNGHLPIGAREKKINIHENYEVYPNFCIIVLKIPVRTSQETHYVSATKHNR